MQYVEWIKLQESWKVCIKNSNDLSTTYSVRRCRTLDQLIISIITKWLIRIHEFAKRQFVSLAQSPGLPILTDMRYIYIYFFFPAYYTVSNKNPFSVCNNRVYLGSLTWSIIKCCNINWTPVQLLKWKSTGCRS